MEFEKELIELEKKLDFQRQSTDLKSEDIDVQKDVQNQISDLIKKLYTHLRAWDIVQIARHPERLQFLDYVDLIFDDFIELLGDRQGYNDQSIIGGMAFLGGRKVFILGQQRGRSFNEITQIYNRGMVKAEGYRKALRLMKLSEKFKKPLITFIDTPGAYPGIDAEKKNQGQAIASNLKEMNRLKIPIVSVIIGEGGSGGALGIGVADQILMLTYSIYSVISPEGAASILFRDSGKCKEASEKMQLTAKDLLRLNIIDTIINEPLGGIHRFKEQGALSVKQALLAALDQLGQCSVDDLLQTRKKKYQQMGMFDE